jgi:[histone H3]-lysine4 N-trimethyltransferase MLL3
MNDGSMSPVASPSPNSRNQFAAPSNKGRMMNPHSPSSNFQHPGRPVSTQLQRQQSQQRMNHSPFSPQAGTPQSPHEAFPESPSNEGFVRQSSEEQFLHSPQTPKSVSQQQSPVHIASGSNMSFGQTQNQTQQLNIRPLDAMGGYVQAPGTPRPSFNPGQTRTTVYARPDMFNKPPFIMGGNRSEHFSPQPNQATQSPQDQNNRQLRDLLQRQQAPTNVPSPVPHGTHTAPSFNIENDQMKNQQNVIATQSQQVQLQQNQTSDNTFRQPLPPGMRQPRMQSMSGGQMIRSAQTPNIPQRMIMNPDNRPRLGPVRPGAVLNPQQMITVQQQQLHQQRMNTSNIGNMEMMTQGQPNIIGNNDQNSMITQRLIQPGQKVIMQQNLQSASVNTQSQLVGANDTIQVPTTVNPSVSDAEGIPDSVTAELEKLEQDENVGMDGVGDILGGLGDDDDDLLDSLTAEMGADFNILEYADPELDTTDDEKTNLLDSLELDDSDTKDDKSKNQDSGKLSKTNLINNTPQHTNIKHQAQLRHGQIPAGNQIPVTVNQNDSQNINQNPGTSQQASQINQMGAQQVILNPQGAINNFQRQQVRIKTIPPNQIPEIQQIHQQMMLQVRFEISSKTSETILFF